MWAVVARTVAIHSCTAVATNSGPLSERMWPGTPRRMKRSESMSIDDVDRLEPARDPNGQALVGELVDNVEHAELASIVGALLDKVVRPDVIAALGSQP